jgi:hypothetical protein
MREVDLPPVREVARRDPKGLPEASPAGCLRLNLQAAYRESERLPGANPMAPVRGQVLAEDHRRRCRRCAGRHRERLLGRQQPGALKPEPEPERARVRQP